MFKKVASSPRTVRSSASTCPVGHRSVPTRRRRIRPCRAPTLAWPRTSKRTNWTQRKLVERNKKTRITLRLIKHTSSARAAEDWGSLSTTGWSKKRGHPQRHFNQICFCFWEKLFFCNANKNTISFSASRLNSLGRFTLLAIDNNSKRNVFTQINKKRKQHSQSYKWRNSQINRFTLTMENPYRFSNPSNLQSVQNK